MEELLDKATFWLKKDLPFVLYSVPKSNILKGIFQDNVNVHFTTDFTETGFVFAPFDNQKKAILLYADEVLTARIETQISNLNLDSDVSFDSDLDKQQYIILLEKAIKSIKAGRLDKVVLSRNLSITCKPNRIQLFQRMLNFYPNAFSYLWHHPKVGTWLGATPEILLRTKGLGFETMSLAGTQSRIEFEEPKWTSKELNEQQMVTNYIQDILKEVSLNITKTQVESIKAGQLWHLRTKLEGSYESSSFGKLLKSLHPTPAVCGTPLDSAKSFILENESYDRRFYTGFLGELNFKNVVDRNKNKRNTENSAYKSVIKSSELFVNLRCMKLFEEGVEIYVGGGITADSKPEKEWRETVSKSYTMLKVLGYY